MRLMLVYTTPATTSMTDDESCPVCKSSKYLNPKLTLLVSPCYHRMCETCINRLFLHGNAPCPICGTVLRKGNFVTATFEDLRVEKEIRIRRVVQKALFKLPEDFDNDEEYNNYLEEVEDIVFNLTNDVDVQSTSTRLEAFRTENRDVVERALARASHDQRQERAAQEEAQRGRQEAKLREAQEEAQEASIKKAMKRELIEKLATSNAPAAVVLAEAQKKLKSASKASSTKITSVPLQIRRSQRSTTEAVNTFNPLERIQPLQTRLPLPELATIPDSIVLELMEEFMPRAPSAIQTQQREWRIERQMAAGGFSIDLIKRHCLRAALSWGL